MRSTPSAAWLDGDGQAERGPAVARRRGRGRLERRFGGQAIAAHQMGEALGLEGQHQALARVDGGGSARGRLLGQEVVQRRGVIAAGRGGHPAHPQQPARGVGGLVGPGRLRGGAAGRRGDRELERLPGDQHHRRQRLRGGEAGQQRLGALDRAQALLAPGAGGDAVVVAPVARLERDRLAQRGPRFLDPPGAAQRVSQRRPALAQRRVELDRAGRRRDGGGQRRDVGHVVDARRLVAEDVGVGQSGVGRGVVRGAGHGAAERLGGRRQRRDTQRLERRPASFPGHERLEAGDGARRRRPFPAAQRSGGAVSSATGATKR